MRDAGAHRHGKLRAIGCIQGCAFKALEFKDQGIGIRVHGFVVRVWSLEFRVLGFELSM